MPTTHALFFQSPQDDRPSSIEVGIEVTLLLGLSLLLADKLYRAITFRDENQPGSPYFLDFSATFLFLTLILKIIENDQAASLDSLTLSTH